MEVPNDVQLRVYTDREWVEKIENQDTGHGHAPIIFLRIC